VDEIGCACTGEPACYEGPPATRGIGECRDGTRSCDDRGELFGPCAGSVVPGVEACNALDDDCDGETDEGCCNGLPCADMGRPDAGGPGGDTGGGPDPGDELTSEGFTVGEERREVPVDYVMVVDNSGSMNDTITQVEANLGDLAARLAGAGLNFRFVLVSERGDDRDDTDVCIPPPLAGPACGNTERFLHLDQRVRSHDAFERVLECIDQCDDGAGGFRNFLRPGALLQLIVVTDDEADLPWPQFRDQMAANGYEGVTLHGVVGLRDVDCVADVGREYIQGAQETGGELLHICDRDWGRVLEVLLDSTITQIQSVYPLAGRPDPATLRVFVQPPGGAEQEALGRWDYDPAGNAVVFRDGFVPLVGSLVTVRYRAL
jgi:hypothetical protein